MILCTSIYNYVRPTKNCGNEKGKMTVYANMKLDSDGFNFKMTNKKVIYHLHSTVPRTGKPFPFI